MHTFTMSVSLAFQYLLKYKFYNKIFKAKSKARKNKIYKTQTKPNFKSMTNSSSSSCYSPHSYLFSFHISTFS